MSRTYPYNLATYPPMNYSNITDEQRIKIVALRKASNHSLYVCRRALELSEWNEERASQVADGIAEEIAARVALYLRSL